MSVFASIEPDGPESVLRRPNLKLARNDWVQWVLALLLAAGAIYLITALIGGGEQADDSLVAKTETAQVISAPPPLELPDYEKSKDAELVFLPVPETRSSKSVPLPQQQPAVPPGQQIDRPPPLTYDPPAPRSDQRRPERDPRPVEQARMVSSKPVGALVIDQGMQRSPSSMAPQPNTQNGGRALDPIRPIPADQSPTLIRSGTLVPAVLETALDTSRTGVARAMVTSDVRGFDGSEVLIARGSRLIGNYGTDAAPGQHRILVTWNRLILPDGRQVIIDFPAVDQEGATGIEGRVHSNFLGRFAGALFQTALDIATLRIANEASDGSVVIAPTGAVTNAARGLAPEQGFQRKITVKAGERVMVFVSQDIEFSPEAGPRR